jgi:hypothetical protein
MGCVWLEIYTVLLGERLEDFEHRHLTSADDFTEFETPEIDSDFHGFAANLPRTHQWIETLLLYCNMHGSLVLGETEKLHGLDLSCHEIRQGLQIVEQMLQGDPDARPSAAELSEKLGSNRCCEQEMPVYEAAKDSGNVEAKETSKPNMILGIQDADNFE